MTRFNLTELNKIIQQTTERLLPEPVDSIFTVRLIGEFSSGKSRLIRELLANKVDAELLPVSSLDRQTMMPLDITWGKSPSLALYDNDQLLANYNHFPHRDAQKKFFNQGHRLRLEIPFEQLILPEAISCDDATGIRERLRIIDMPGWNSDDSVITENPLKDGLVGEYNLALVYVTKSVRVDSQDNLARLKAIFIEASEGGAYFYTDEIMLTIVITECNPDEYSKQDAKIRSYITQLADECDCQVKLHVQAIDFALKKNDDFDHWFWDSIVNGIDYGDEKTLSWSLNPSDGTVLKNCLAQSQICWQEMRELFKKFRINDHFLHGMNWTRLEGLNHAEQENKLHQSWRRQLALPAQEELSSFLSVLDILDEDHPLAPWWNQYWQPAVKETVELFYQFLSTTAMEFRYLTNNPTIPINTYLSNQLTPLYQQLDQQLNDSSVSRTLDALTQTSIENANSLFSTWLMLCHLESVYHGELESASD